MQKNLYKRLMRIEALANAQKAEMDDVLFTAYERARKDGDVQGSQ